jgi:hypothetical protein
MASAIHDMGGEASPNTGGARCRDHDTAPNAGTETTPTPRPFDAKAVTGRRRPARTAGALDRPLPPGPRTADLVGSTPAPFRDQGADEFCGTSPGDTWPRQHQ